MSNSETDYDRIVLVIEGRVSSFLMTCIQAFVNQLNTSDTVSCSIEKDLVEDRELCQETN